MNRATAWRRQAARKPKMNGSTSWNSSSIPAPAASVTWCSPAGGGWRAALAAGPLAPCWPRGGGLGVGAGRGSMATWLAERVGPTGQVVATDIDCRYLARLDLPNLRVAQHNILDDPLDALGPGSFDLVCTRLVLFWLVDRQETAIHQMAAYLCPAGWLIDEEGDWGVPGPIDPIHPLYAGYHHAFKNGEWWASRGYDPFFGRKLPALFERCGLQNIDHQATATVVRGASPWTRWWQQNLDVIR